MCTSLQVENGIKNLVQIKCIGVSSTTVLQPKEVLLRCFRNTISLNYSFSRCFMRCSSRAGWAVATITPFATTTTTLFFWMDALLLCLEVAWGWRYCSRSDRNDATTKRCQRPIRFVPTFECYQLLSSASLVRHLQNIRKGIFNLD
jgi:hypothetical protein